MLCPRGEARKIGASGPSEKRSVNPIIQRGEGVFAVHHGLGPAGRARREHDVREVGDALDGKRAFSYLTWRRHLPRPAGIVEQENAQLMPAGRGGFPGDIAQPRSTVALQRNQCPRARQPGRRRATVSGSVRVGKLAGMAPRAQQCDERHLPVDDVRQREELRYRRDRFRPLPAFRRGVRPTATTSPWLSCRPVVSATARRSSKRWARTA